MSHSTDTLYARHVDVIADIQQLFDDWKISLNKVTPKMQLSADCPVTDDFRAETNQWMAEFFGMHPDIPNGYLIFDDAHKIAYGSIDTIKYVLHRWQTET